MRGRSAAMAAGVESPQHSRRSICQLQISVTACERGLPSAGGGWARLAARTPRAGARRALLSYALPMRRSPALCLLCLLLIGCQISVPGVEDGGGPPGEPGADGSALGDGGVVVPAGDGGTRVCIVTKCQNHVYQCGDCTDDDGDGRIDSDDLDCLGPCDNTEDSFFPNIPGGNNAPCKADCYFDQDTGSGNDQCYWDHRCDPHEFSSPHDPEGARCRSSQAEADRLKLGGGLSCAEADRMQSKQCHDLCGPLTPNGCDCFGCCSFPQIGYTVWLGSTDENGRPSCSLATVGDPTRCKPCKKVAACDKPCERCQLCIGKDTLPPDCLPGPGSDGGPAPGQCPPGVQACGLPGQGPCPPTWYCVTGCCAPPLG